MSSNSPRHACDQGSDLIIEVLGLVDEKQKLVLLRNNELFLPFEKSVTTNDSTKFIVDDYMPCDQQTNANDVIAINTGSDDKPYYVPLTGEVMLKPARPAKDGKREQARINAAVPYTSLDAHMLTQQAGSDNQALEKIIALPQGFLYVFNNGRLWREIVVDYSQDNCLIFTDLDIAAWREHWQEDQPHLPRVIAGQAQDTIWFPQDISAISGEKKKQIDFAFSSEPWSSAYINWLEKGKKRFLSRTQSPARVFEQFWKEKFDPRTAHYTAPVNDIKPQNPRQPIIEQALLQPTRFLHDLSGQYPREQKNKSELAVQAISDPKTFNAEKLAELEPEFVLPALSKQVSKAGPKKDQKAEIPATAIGEIATGDCFTRVRDKAINGFMVADVRGAIHQYLSQMESSAGCLSLLCEACYYAPYGTSSMLVNSLVRASKTGTQDNPYHSDKINLQPGTVFASGIMLYERWVMHQNLSSAMASLYQLVSDTPLVINSLRDLFSLDDADYIAGFMEVPALLAALNIKVEDIDKLATKDELKWVRNDSALQGSGADFKKQLSLSGIFDFMGVSEGNCTAGNDGSGLFRPYDFEKICDANHAIWQKNQFDTPYPALFMQREKEQQQAMAVVEKKLVEQQRHSNVAGDLMYEMAVTSFGLMRRVTGGMTALFSEYANTYAQELLENAKGNGTKKQFLTSHIYTGTKNNKVGNLFEQLQKTDANLSAKNALLSPLNEIIDLNEINDQTYNQLKKQGVPVLKGTKNSRFYSGGELVASNHRNDLKLAKNTVHHRNSLATYVEVDTKRENIALRIWWDHAKGILTGLTLIDTINLTYAIKGSFEDYRKMGEVDAYLVASSFSALADLTVTSLTLYREVIPLSKVSLKVNSTWFTIMISHNDKWINVNYLKGFGLVAGGLTAILDIWQGVRLINDKDSDAGIASIFAGVGMGIAMGSEYLASTALLAAMGLTPFGILLFGLSLGVGGMFLRELWKDNKLDKWLIGQEDKSIDPSPFYTGIENKKNEIELIAELFRLIEMNTSFKDVRDSSMTIASGLLSHPSMALLKFEDKPILSIELKKHIILSSARNQRSFITPMVKGKWLNSNEGQIIGFDCLYHQNEIAAKYALSTVVARWQGELVLFDINHQQFVPKKLVFSYKKNDSEQQYNDGKLEIEWLA